MISLFALTGVCLVIGTDENLERLTTILQPSTRVHGVEAGVDCICVDVTGVLRALRTEWASAIPTVLMSHPWGGPGWMRSSRFRPGSSWWKKPRGSEMMLEEMTNPCAQSSTLMSTLWN